MAFDRTLLITGGAGFIGANFVTYFARRYPNYRLLDLDALTYAADRRAFEAQQSLPNVVTIAGDIRNASNLANLLETWRVTGIIHFAAESHVDNSITDPLRFVDTNVNGTVALLNEALRYWRAAGLMETARFHHISTDEVYGSLGSTGFFTESSPYAPNGPYSASKAASDHLVRAYCRTYGLNATISNCSNNYGPHQHREKLIPTIIAKCLSHEAIPIYGTGSNIRDWIWVEDHCRAVDLIFHKGRMGESYNVGAHTEKTNLQMVAAVCGLLDRLRPWAGHRYVDLMRFVTDRPGHDFRYAIDAGKIARELGWKPLTGFEEGLEKTVRWYLEKRPDRLLPEAR